MNHNMLNLYDDKTELIVFTSKYKQDLYNNLSIMIGDLLWIVIHMSRTLGSSLIECYRYVSMFLILHKQAGFTLEPLAE